MTAMLRRIGAGRRPDWEFAVILEMLALLAVLQSGPLTVSGPAHALSADTVLVDGRAVRLRGLAGFPPGTRCDEADGPLCEEMARRSLDDQITSARETRLLLVQQNQPQYGQSPDIRCTLVDEAQGDTPSGRCEVLIPACQGVSCEDVWYDLADEVIASGAGLQRREESLGAYDEAEQVARAAALGGWATTGR